MQQAALAMLHMLEVVDAAALLGQTASGEAMRSNAHAFAPAGPTEGAASLQTAAEQAAGGAQSEAEPAPGTPLPAALAAKAAASAAVAAAAHAHINREQQHLLETAAQETAAGLRGAAVASTAPGLVGSAAGEGLAVLQRHGRAAGGHALQVEVLEAGQVHGNVPGPGPGMHLKVSGWRRRRRGCQARGGSCRGVLQAALLQGAAHNDVWISAGGAAMAFCPCSALVPSHVPVQVNASLWMMSPDYAAMDIGARCRSRGGMAGWKGRSSWQQAALCTAGTLCSLCENCCWRSRPPCCIVPHVRPHDAR